MIVINNFSDTRFTLNGIQYFKNFISEVAGDQLKIYNAYDKKDVRSDYKHFSQYSVNGTVYGSVSALQSALLPVIYTRASLGGGFEQNNTWREVFLGFYSNPTERNALFNQTLIVTETENIMLVYGYQNPELLVTEPPTIYRYKWANGKGTFNPIPKVEGEDIIFESVTQVNGGDIITIINGANTQTFDLGDIGSDTIVDFINDNGPYDLTDTELVHYFIYESDGITYLYQFIGTNGTYGDGETPITESDLKFITSSGVEPAIFEGQSTILIEATLSDLGVSTFDEVTPAKLAEYSATLDIEAGLNQDIDYKISEGITEPYLRISTTNIENFALEYGVTDPSDISEWNVTFELLYTGSFENCEVNENEIIFRNGVGLTSFDLSDSAFDNYEILDWEIRNMHSFTSFILYPDSTEIDQTKIFNCPNLENISLSGNSGLKTLRNVFRNLENLTDFNFSGVELIENNAFIGCTALNNISFSPNDLTVSELNKLANFAENFAPSGGTLELSDSLNDLSTSTVIALLTAKSWTINL